MFATFAAVVVPPPTTVSLIHRWRAMTPPTGG